MKQKSKQNTYILFVYTIIINREFLLMNVIPEPSISHNSYIQWGFSMYIVNLCIDF